MGFWSKTLMGSDDALDAESVFLQTCGLYDAYLESLDKDNPFHLSAWKRRVDEHLADLIEVCEHGTAGQDWIVWPALGVFLMQAGAAMPESVKTRILNIAGNDDWATQDPERKYFMDQFMQQISAYPEAGGTPVEVATESLFQRFEAQMAEGGSGLLNIFPPRL